MYEINLSGSLILLLCIFVIVNKTLNMVTHSKGLKIPHLNFLVNCISRSYANNGELEILVIVIYIIKA